jgi:hypothetical protein
MAQERRAVPERRAARERRAAPRNADSRRKPAGASGTATLSPIGTDNDTRPAVGPARAGRIVRDAERGGDARTVTERHAGTASLVAPPPGERRRRPASAELQPPGGTPRMSNDARASGRPALTHKAGRADSRMRGPGWPQPQPHPVTRRPGTSRPSRGIGDVLSATLSGARAALRGLVARQERAVRRLIRRWSSRVAAAVRDLAGRRGGVQRAAVAALRAFLAGRNPVLAAMKAWFAALSTPMKVLVIAGVVLLALFAPLLLLLLLLALAVAVVVIVVRAPDTDNALT